MKTIKLFAFAGIFFLFFFFSAVASHAEPVNLIYINGIMNTLEDAKKTNNKIQEILDSKHSDMGDRYKSFKVCNIWNPIGFYGKKGLFVPALDQDITELFLLKTAEEHYFQDFLQIISPFNMSQSVDQEAAHRIKEYLIDMTPEDTCLTTTDARMERTQNTIYELIAKIKNLGSSVVVAHSQGNLLANLAYADLVSSYGNDTKNMVRVVNVANTSAFSVNNLSLTHEKDGALFYDPEIGFGLSSLEAMPSVVNCKRTTPECQDDICFFMIASPTFGEPIPYDPGSLNHGMMETYLSTANVPVLVNQGVAFTPGAEQFKDRFVDFVYAAANSFNLSNNSSNICGAYIAPGVWKEFDCYNLAAIGKTTNDDPFTPSWRLIGGYWQWGRKGPDSSQWYDTNTTNFAHGPTSPDAADANADGIDGWDTSYALDGAWSDSEKTANDPCPAGYRIPTRSQWDGVKNNNNQSIVGSWSITWDNQTNYSGARFFGDNLMLPAAGHRDLDSGAVGYRGNDGKYWSSTQRSTPSGTAWGLGFGCSYAGTYGSHRSYGISVRCVAE